MQSPERSIIDALVADTVHNLLFEDDPVRPESLTDISSIETPESNPSRPEQLQENEDDNEPTTPQTPREAPAQDSDLHATKLLGRLFANDEQRRPRGKLLLADVTQQQVLRCCCRWSRETLAEVKAILKGFLRTVSAARQNSKSGDAKQCTRVFEAYALVKLFLLEKDEQYRAVKIESCGRTRLNIVSPSRRVAENARFLMLLQVQLALYAQYFEVANGRKVRSYAS